MTFREQQMDSLRPAKRTRRKSSAEFINHHTKILASLLPDEIVYNLEDRSIRTYNAAVLVADVSGFTELCEKYNKTGKGGPSRLTEILNGFIGSMVQEILSSGGDVLKYSGDAFLTWWKSSPEKSMQDAVNQAVECAIVIQKNYGRYETDVHVTLKVKLAIAAGQVLFSIIGDGKVDHYIVVGDPVLDVKDAEKLCSSGDVMLSPTAWQFINIQDYEYSFMPDQEHIKVTGLAPWKTLQSMPPYLGNQQLRSTTLPDFLSNINDDGDEDMFNVELARVSQMNTGSMSFSKSEVYSL